MSGRVFPGLVAFGVLGMSALPWAQAQTHAVKKPETVVRAVGVYEFTGDESKPTAMRLVPVSLFINGRLEDAGIYMARPAPFALQAGTLYEAQRSGLPEGLLELAFSNRLSGGEATEIEDGWEAFGLFQPKPKEVLLAHRQSGPLSKIEVGGGKPAAASDDRPHMTSRNGGSSGSSSGSSRPNTSGTTAGSDPDRPTLHRAPNSGSDSGSASAPASSGDSTSSKANAPTPAPVKVDDEDEADRPTLRRRTPAQTKADQKKKDSARVVAGNDLNDDPDRPTLHRGSTRNPEQDIVPLRGTPPEMHQLVAVSDAHTREPLDFARAWESDTERAQVLAKMQGFARAKLAAYKEPGAPAAAAVAVAPATAKAGTHAAARRKQSATGATAHPPVALAEEQLRGFTLSYGGSPTYAYAATTADSAGATRYVWVVAQDDPMNGLKVALSGVSDSSHLDDTPWMRLVDAVDAEASNRASLLFELREQHTRQFALYRVIGGEATQSLVTGTTE